MDLFRTTEFIRTVFVKTFRTFLRKYIVAQSCFADLCVVYDNLQQTSKSHNIVLKQNKKRPMSSHVIICKSRSKRN